MKKIIFATVSSLLILSFILCACASKDKTADQTTEQGTEEVTEPAPVYKRPEKFPKEINFDDEEEIKNMFDMSDILDGVTVTVNKKAKAIIMKATIHDVKFSLTVVTAKAAGLTTPEQMSNCAQLFWYCYPQEYFRLKNDKSPTSLSLNFENEGYEVASCGGNFVHIHDKWLHDHPTDYDCLTHEFTHAIQGGWDGVYSPAYENDTYMIERFADYGRYVYAFNKGQYNDKVWELQTVSSENTYYKSVRFWVWLDFTYSTKEADIMQRINYYVRKGGRDAASKNWGTDGPMWEKVFKDTGAAGKTIDDLWKEYKNSEFAKAPSITSSSPVSKLIKQFNVREVIKQRVGTLDDYLKLGRSGE